MSITLSEELTQELESRAEERDTTVAALVCEAMRWYLGMDPELLDELASWQEVRDEALTLVDNGQ
jgi:predicted transcriptional regulator